MSPMIRSRPLLSLLLLTSCGRFSTDRPNVLLIVIDTLRADRLSCYGSTRVQTPAMDRLAREGVRFDAAFTQAAVTFPSLCSIMTSLYPYRHQARSNESILHDQFLTLAELFRSSGYQTGAVVGSAVLARDRNLSQGFDSYDDQFPESWEVYNEALKTEGLGAGSVSQRRAAAVTQTALVWMEKHHNQPFFLFAHYFDPHSNYDPPPPFDVLYSSRRYDGEVAYTDREVGRLIAGLDRMGLASKTLVVLTADHGEGLGDHDEREHGFFVYESTIRVPFVMRFPGVLPAGKVVSEIVSTVDLMPTVAGLAGIENPEKTDGRNLVPLLGGEEWRDRSVYSEAFRGFTSYGWSPTRSIRTTEWKYVDAPQKELYHVSVDPEELRNLYEEGDEIGARLESLMEEHFRAERQIEPLPGVIDTMDRKQRKRLEALGYISRSGSVTKEGYSDLLDPKVAIQSFNNQQEARALTRKARVQIDRQMFQKAKPLLDEALELHPTYFPALSLLAEIYVREGREGEAEQLYLGVIEKELEDARSYANAAVALVNLGRMEEGVVAMRKATRLEPGNAQYQRMQVAFEQALATGEKIQVRVNFK